MNQKIDKLLENDRNFKINQTAMLKMQIEFLKEQKELRKYLEEGNTYYNFI